METGAAMAAAPIELRALADAYFLPVYAIR